MKTRNTNFKYFTLSELDSKGTNDQTNTGYLIDLEFIRLLDKARGLAGIPLKANSGYRTSSHIFVGSIPAPRYN